MPSHFSCLLVGLLGGEVGQGSYEKSVYRTKG